MNLTPSRLLPRLLARSLVSISACVTAAWAATIPNPWLAGTAVSAVVLGYGVYSWLTGVWDHGMGQEHLDGTTRQPIDAHDIDVARLAVDRFVVDTRILLQTGNSEAAVIAAMVESDRNRKHWTRDELVLTFATAVVRLARAS